MVQLRRVTTADEDELKQANHEEATLNQCPLHPTGGCGFTRHGYYKRKRPEGLRIPRWYCRLGRTTFSLIPDFAATRFSSSLAEFERSVREAEQICRRTASLELAARILRPDISRASAVRWLRRRRQRLGQVLNAAAGIVLVLLGAQPTLSQFAQRLGAPHDGVLLALRKHEAMPLVATSVPVGFDHRRRARTAPAFGRQHKMGADTGSKTAVGPPPDPMVDLE